MADGYLTWLLRGLQRGRDRRPTRSSTAAARRGPLCPRPGTRQSLVDTLGDPARQRNRMTPKIALVTGATQGLGLALVEGLAQRLTPQDTVYLTGRDVDRVTAAVGAVPSGGAQVRGEILDVSRPVNQL